MSRRLPPHHAENETVRIAALSNDQLVKETIYEAAGDDYDGCFTDAGMITFDLLKAELTRRLVAVGFATDKLWDEDEQ